MPLDDPFATATDMAAAIRRGDTSATALLQAHFDRVDQINPAINAIIWQDRDGALTHAHTLDQEARQGNFRGPFHGVPVTLKEAFDWPGSPSTWGVPAWADNIPETPSPVAQRYLDAGGNVFGKTNVPLNLAEWQSFNDIYGTTNNPWDQTRTPGGSSGGSAAALATGMTPLEAGSDIGSSIRNPAHYCGVFGLKPTWGVVPMIGHLPPNWHTEIDIAVTGPMARSAVDLTTAFDVLSQSTGPRDDRTDLSQFRVAVMLGDPVCPVDQPYLDQLANFTDRLAQAGTTVALNTRPDIDSDAHFDLYLTLLGAALSFGYTQADVEAEIARIEASGSVQAKRIMRPRSAGKSMRHAEWLVANDARAIARSRFDDFFADWDILLAPVSASAAFPHDHNGPRDTRVIPINGHPQTEMLQLFWSGYSGVVGLPSAVGPAGFVNHLPVGYQAIAGHGRDHTALAFARAVETQLGGFVPPPDFA
ncbi:amidase family protein [Phaeobacter marinintestinus]|uniref:amidase family protein n=1 Tax=Falsiphaeobacter marinintestinus TaxID=1492905 RepID=UPI0011B58DF1|nr:amidase family protein [Phaeobacter marinintestinus]